MTMEDKEKHLSQETMEDLEKLRDVSLRNFIKEARKLRKRIKKTKKEIEKVIRDNDLDEETKSHIVRAHKEILREYLKLSFSLFERTAEVVKDLLEEINKEIG